jgi:hypothetical protein
MVIDLCSHFVLYNLLFARVGAIAHDGEFEDYKNYVYAYYRNYKYFMEN